MEVHHHPHVEKKSFKEYLLEGLMIFLAVSMGFIAENVREYFTDKEREHQYIEAFVKDLKADTASLNRNIKGNIRKEVGLDSLIIISHSDLTKQENAKKFIEFFLRSTGIPTHNPRLSAITQLKNTGSLRLVDNKNGSIDSILKYDAFNQVIISHNDFLREINSDAFTAFYPIADVRIFVDTAYCNFFRKTLTNKETPPLNLTKEKLDIFLGYETRHILTNTVNRNYMMGQLSIATRLIEFFEKEYHLKDESLIPDTQP